MPAQVLSPESFKTFGDLLKYLRRRERLTQMELSISVGYSEGQISRLEQNQRLPDISAVRALFIPALHLQNEHELSTRLLHLAQTARLEDAPTPGIAPYKGLLFFDQTDADLFFGRETITTHMEERVSHLAMDASSRFLVIVGASGSGKSSLVRAGLAVALHRLGWEIHTFTPTANPLQILATNYQPNNTNNGQNHLVLVDQFEETFTLCRDENERAVFIERLISIARDPSIKTTVVIALRADFYSHCAQYPHLREAVAAEQEYIGQMTQEELRRAIEEPAKRGSWEFERGLVDILLSDVGADGMGQPEPGALPLLAHALLATWERRRGRTLTLEGYRAAGGVRSAIAETAESVFTDQLNQAQQDLARDIFLRLTELGEGTEDTRRRASLYELAHKSEETVQLRTVLNTLANARLITLNADSAEVAHEALIREWHRLREWLSQDREGLRLHRHLTDAALEWEARQREASELYRGARLAQTREWAAANPGRLNAAEHAFIASSIEQEQQVALEREAQRQGELKSAQDLAQTQSQAAKQLRRRAIYLTGALLLAIALAGVAIFFGNRAYLRATEAQAANRIATSRELAGASLINLNIDPERSILLALEAEAQADTFQAQDALHRALQTSRLLKRVSVSLGECYCLIAFSPDGKRLATESRDADGQLTTQIRDATTLEVLFTKPGIWADDRWLDASYLPIAAPSAGRSSTILTVWDATGQKVMTTVTLPIYFDDNAPFIDISPDRTKVAAVSSVDRGNLSVYDISTGRQLPHVGKPGYGYNSMLRFSPDSRTLFTNGAPTDDNQEVTLWDVSTGSELLTVPIQGVPGLIDFSPNGKRFAVNDSQIVRIVDIASGQEVVTLSGHAGSVENGLQFNADGTQVVTAAGDGMIRIWDAATGQVLLSVFGSDARIKSAAFSPDGTQLATLSEGSVQTWAIAQTDPNEILAMQAVLDCDCMIAFSPDGLKLAAFGGDQTVKIMDSRSGKTLLTLPDPDNQGRGLAFSPDGTRLATAGADHQAHVWDLVTGEELMDLSGSTASVDRVIFSPDGSRLATFDRSGEARLWDATSGQMLFSLQVFENNTIQEINPIGISFSSDGSRLATAGGAFIKIWDVVTGQARLTVPLDEGKLAYAVAFSPDSKHLAVSFRGGVVNVMDAASGQKLFDMPGHTGSVRHIVYIPDGTRIATASADGTTRLWDAATGLEQFALIGHTGQVTGVAFSPDGARLATSSRDGTVRVYALRPDDLIQIAKTRVTRSLTIEECQKYLHMDACPAMP
jgi:WD40 repeat protein/transcriptional regulator with XRE-family HTH domain/energy-coupling factor transporter ATP-binding protein EcfA2